MKLKSYPCQESPWVNLLQFHFYITFFFLDLLISIRFAWIEQVKEEGNKFVKTKEYGQALDKYLNALYGLDFKDQSIEMEKRINFELKVPILNNMSLCLLKVKEFRKVNCFPLFYQ